MAVTSGRLVDPLAYFVGLIIWHRPTLLSKNFRYARARDLPFGLKHVRETTARNV